MMAAGIVSYDSWKYKLIEKVFAFEMHQIVAKSLQYPTISQSGTSPGLPCKGF